MPSIFSFIRFSPTSILITAGVRPRGMMKKAILVGLLAWGTATLAHAAEPLTLTTTEFPPYMSAAMPEGGVLVALTRAAMRQSGTDVRVQFMPWARALNEVRSGNADGLIGAWHSREREDYLVFPDPLLNNEIGFFGRRDRTPLFSSLSDLKGLRIGTVRGYANPPSFLAADLDSEEEGDDFANLRKLEAGRIDLVLIDRLVAEYLIAARMPDARPRMQWLEPAVSKTPIYTTFSKAKQGHELAVKQLNLGLQKIRNSGEFSAILLQYKIAS